MVKILERALFTKLSSIENVDVFTARADDNITGDFIVLQRTDSERWRHINAPDGIAQAKIQIDCYSLDYWKAKEIAAEVEAMLDGFVGIVYYGDDSPQNFVDIAGVTMQNDFDTFDNTEEPFLYRNLSNFTVTYKQ